MQPAAFSVPFSLILFALGLGTAACGTTADASQPDLASPGPAAETPGGDSNAGADGGASPGQGSGHVNTPARWAPLAHLDGGAAGAWGAAEPTPLPPPGP